MELTDLKKNFPDKIKLSTDKYRPKAIIQRKKNYLRSDIDLKKKKTIW